MVTKKMLSAPKLTNNNRIVVVGASDTGISFIESLISIKDLNFQHITLLSPGGFVTMHITRPEDQLRAVSTNYSLEELRSIMIDARVTVLDAKMVELDKKNKKIRIDKLSMLPYDVLVITTGLIDTELQNRDLVSCGLANFPYYRQTGAKFITGVYSIDDPYLYHHFANSRQKGSNLQLLTRNKKPQNITLYGRNLNAVAFISGLINRGVSPSRIFYVLP